jgi:hypothetical protein
MSYSQAVLELADPGVAPRIRLFEGDIAHPSPTEDCGRGSARPGFFYAPFHELPICEPNRHQFIALCRC